MPYSIPSSTKILTLTTAPFLFVLVSVRCLSFCLSVCLSACKFAMVPEVLIILSPQEEEVHCSS